MCFGSYAICLHSLIYLCASIGFVRCSARIGFGLFVLYNTPLSLLSLNVIRSSIIHNYVDDSQLQNSATPDRLPDLIDSMRLCIDHINDWMTDI